MKIEDLNPSKFNGKKIFRLEFPDGHCEFPFFPNIDLIFCSSYHGDHDEFWICKIRNGKEEERYNPRYVTKIVWEND